MAKALTMCAIGIWLSTAVLDVANAVGTFRLTGPWPSSSAERKVTQGFDGCDHQRVHRSLHKHAHQVCMRDFPLLTSRPARTQPHVMSISQPMPNL
jgi:hypothetical protein